MKVTTSLPAGMRMRCTRSNESTGTLRAAPPSTETEPLHPWSQATERTIVAGPGASTRTSSDLVLLEITWTVSGWPFVVLAEIGTGGLDDVNTA